MNKINAIQWLRDRIHNNLRINARVICSIFIVTFSAGIFPDAISHGIILSERGGHEILAQIGILLILFGIVGIWICHSLHTRFLAYANGILELVANDK